MNVEIDSPIKICRVNQDALGEIFEFLQPFMQRNQLLPRTIEEIGNLLNFAFAARNKEAIIGFAAVEVYSKKLAELQCLAVDPDFRRRGIGKSLVAKCAEIVEEIGIQELMAISASDEMFRACGFEYSLPNQKRALFYRPGDD